jgi:hypothetical protein
MMFPRVPRIPPAVNGVAAVAALLVVPYYVVTGQGGAALMMLALAGLNVASARK